MRQAFGRRGSGGRSRKAKIVQNMPTRPGMSLEAFPERRHAQGHGIDAIQQGHRETVPERRVPGGPGLAQMMRTSAGAFAYCRQDGTRSGRESAAGSPAWGPHFSHFIQEQRAAFGCADEAWFGRGGARKGALLVTE